MCEITPRDDERDEEVLKCYRMMNSCVSSQGNIYVAYHSNLRDETFSLFRDNKHTKESKIPKFASNKKGLCEQLMVLLIQIDPTVI